MSAPFLSWNDEGQFAVGVIYQDNDTDEIVEYLGEAWMPELDGARVEVFRFLEHAGCLIATERAYQRGQTFTPIDRVIADDLEL